MQQQDSDPFIAWLRLAMRICGSLADAEDVVQRACLEILQKGNDPTDRLNEGLVKQVIVCRSIDLLRKKQSFNLREITPEHPSDMSGPEDNLQQEECFALLHRGLTQLPPMQSETFAMRYLGNLSVGEIASLLNCSDNSVSVQISKAKRQLQILFKEYYDVRQ